MEVTVLEYQSLFDIAIQVYGSAEATFDLAIENNISITDTLFAGQVLKCSTPVVNTQVVSYYSANGIKPASSHTQQTNSDVCGGIGYMAVEIDFIIN